MKTRLVLAHAIALAALPATAEIYRCGAGGTVTYQEIPCAEGAVVRTDIPTSFPAPNTVERERLLQREADLYRRLEARRDRELVEARMREARAEREAEAARLAALAAPPQYGVAYGWPALRPMPRRAPDLSTMQPRRTHTLVR